MSQSTNKLINQRTNEPTNQPSLWSRELEKLTGPQSFKKFLSL